MKKVFTVLLAICLTSIVAKSQTTTTGKNDTQTKSKPVSFSTSNAISQSATNGTNTIKKIPADAPKYINTGNPETDNENYRVAKENWIKNNPEKYAEMTNKTSGGKQIILKKDFEKLPAARQEYLKSHPEKFEIK